jgi:hypothetical protein
MHDTTPSTQKYPVIAQIVREGDSPGTAEEIARKLATIFPTYARPAARVRQVFAEVR